MQPQLIGVNNILLYKLYLCDNIEPKKGIKHMIKKKESQLYDYFAEQRRIKMSMPNFPEISPEMTRENAINMILASIAMEELGLSHIINAEGEKLQYVLGTLPDKTGCCASVKDILEVNKSVSHLLEKVTENQIILKNKLESVISLVPKCENSSSVCCDEKGKGIFCTPASQKTVWRKDHELKVNCCSISGLSIKWNKDNASQICLMQGKRYLLSFLINLVKCDCGAGRVSVALQSFQDNQYNTLYKYHHPCCSCTGQECSLSCADILISTECSSEPITVSLKLLNPEIAVVCYCQITVIEI